MSKGFYQDLEALHDYSLMVEHKSYRDLPLDWSIVLTDVKNSTKAIEAGLYKEVNMVGVSCIVAVQNALGDQPFPYIFGGDGATIAVPSSDLDIVKKALSHTRAIARKEFKLELRIAVISVSDVLKTGAQLKVSKLKVSENQYLALLRGDGWTLAETWMKEREAEFNLPETQLPEGDMAGLECRWNPLPARKFEVMALIIQSRKAGEPSVQVYREILRELLDPGFRPVSITELRYWWPPKFLRQEAKLRVKSGWPRFTYLLKGFSLTFLYTAILLMRGKKNVTEPIAYLNELTQNTDYLKFDECLRMIIDVSKEQKERLIAKLEAHFKKGDIFYGYHCDPFALMTCFIQGPHKHIHFVDAGGGGYAMAAKQMKAQKRSV